MVEALRRLASRRIEGLEELSDPEIVALCKKELPSDLTAYRELLRRYEGLVYNTCAKYIGSKQDAEEASNVAPIRPEAEAEKPAEDLAEKAKPESDSDSEKPKDQE